MIEATFAANSKRFQSPSVRLPNSTLLSLCLSFLSLFSLYLSLIPTHSLSLFLYIKPSKSISLSLLHSSVPFLLLLSFPVFFSLYFSIHTLFCCSFSLPPSTFLLTFLNPFFFISIYSFWLCFTFLCINLSQVFHLLLAMSLCLYFYSLSLYNLYNPSILTLQYFSSTSHPALYSSIPSRQRFASLNSTNSTFLSTSQLPSPLSLSIHTPSSSLSLLFRSPTSTFFHATPLLSSLHLPQFLILCGQRRAAIDVKIVTRGDCPIARLRGQHNPHNLIAMLISACHKCH